MKLSVLDLVPVPQGASVEESFENALDLARYAESLGFARYWLAEHHGSPYLGSSAPEVLIARIASATTTIRVGSGATLLPYYTPLRVVEVFNTLAALFPGRIDLGLGRGPGASEIHARHLRLGAPDSHADSATSVLEVLAYLDAAFDDEDERHEILATPQPLVPPDVWIMGTSRQSARLAGDFGLPYCMATFLKHEPPESLAALYRAGFASDGWTERPYCAVAVSVVCAETYEEAVQIAEEGGEKQSPSTIIGSPEQVCASLEEIARITAADELVITSLVQDQQARKRSYGFLAEAMVRYSG